VNCLSLLYLRKDYALFQFLVLLISLLHWPIQLWADLAAVPIDQNLGRIMTARSNLPQTLGQIFI